MHIRCEAGRGTRTAECARLPQATPSWTQADLALRPLWMWGQFITSLSAARASVRLVLEVLASVWPHRCPGMYMTEKLMASR